MGNETELKFEASPQDLKRLKTSQFLHPRMGTPVKEENLIFHNRYALLSRDNFNGNPDGSLDLYVQKDSPGCVADAPRRRAQTP
jgi:hypothetical protein